MHLYTHPLDASRRILLLTALALGLACGDDGDTPAAGESSTSLANGTTTSATATPSESSGAEPGSTGLASTGNPDDSSSSSGGVPTACGELPATADPCLRCGQMACAAAFAACCALTEFDLEGMPTTGCLPLVTCALATGCVHAECYDPATCMAEVDGAGGISGDGTAAAGGFGACLGEAVADGSVDACAECPAQSGESSGVG